MLAEAKGIKKTIIAVGCTDLRRGIDGLAQSIHAKYNLDPYDEGHCFCFAVVDPIV